LPPPPSLPYTTLFRSAAEYPDPGARPAPTPPENNEEDVLPGDEAVLRFRRTASPEAFELAVALAAVPLHPGVVSEVCRDVLGREDRKSTRLTPVTFRS